MIRLLTIHSSYRNAGQLGLLLSQIARPTSTFESTLHAPSRSYAIAASQDASLRLVTTAIYVTTQTLTSVCRVSTSAYSVTMWSIGQSSENGWNLIKSNDITLASGFTRVNGNSYICSACRWYLLLYLLDASYVSMPSLTILRIYSSIGCGSNRPDFQSISLDH